MQRGELEDTRAIAEATAGALAAVDRLLSHLDSDELEAVGELANSTAEALGRVEQLLDRIAEHEGWAEVGKLQTPALA